MGYKPREDTSNIIYSAALDLHQSGQVITREALSQITGQKMSVVDDRLKVLVDDGFLRRVERGVFLPIFKHHETRVISKTILPDGSIKIDIGDEVLELTPHEAMILGKNLIGEAMSLNMLEVGNQFAIQNDIHKREIAQLKKQLTYLSKKNKQADLFGATE